MLSCGDHCLCTFIWNNKTLLNIIQLSATEFYSYFEIFSVCGFKILTGIARWSLQMLQMRMTQLEHFCVELRMWILCYYNCYETCFKSIGLYYNMCYWRICKWKIFLLYTPNGLLLDCISFRQSYFVLST